jgi:probable DNA repair protein
LHFTHLWITGMDDSRWPGATRPNPFLPLALQRQLAMPHASVERELDFSRRMSQRLLGAAATVVVSYARLVADSEQRLSPLLRDYPQVELAQLAADDTPLYEEHINRLAPALESYTDDTTAPLNAQQVSAGGTGIFKDQAACPFRANALHRLQARALELPRHGLQAMDRGIILHNVLEDFWRQVQEQTALLAMDSKTLRQCVSDHVSARLQEYQRRKPDALGQRFLAMEQQRLTELVLVWLALESARPPFRVLSPEQEHVHRIAGLPVRIRPDRVDELADGGLALIDYKTGTSVDARHWFGERPEEPQMPVYALANADRVRAVAYGMIRAGTTCFNGVAAADDMLPGVDVAGSNRRKKHLAEFANWVEVLDHWQTQLHALASAFLAGDARVDPKLPAVTCRQCQAQPFCRIYQHADLLLEQDTP